MFLFEDGPNIEPPTGSVEEPEEFAFHDVF
jgi:hypothetical protein